MTSGRQGPCDRAVVLLPEGDLIARRVGRGVAEWELPRCLLLLLSLLLAASSCSRSAFRTGGKGGRASEPVYICVPA
jgi:hypothetical protein